MARAVPAGPSGLNLSSKDGFIALYRLGFAILAITAIALQLASDIENDLSVVNFFSLFTVQSNLIIAVVFLACAWGQFRQRRLPHRDFVRGAAAAYMLTTGLVHIFLLDGLVEAREASFSRFDFVVHYLMPTVALVDWIIDRRGSRFSFRAALLWLAYPLLWLTYTLIRGALTGWYPYPFLDPDENAGYGEVAMTCALTIVAFIPLIWLMARTSGWGFGGTSQDATRTSG